MSQHRRMLSYPLHWLVGGFRTNSAFKLCLQGEAGRSYQVQTSTNLSSTNWLPLGPMEFTSGTWRFWDTNTTNQARRFYRAEQLP